MTTLALKSRLRFTRGARTLEPNKWTKPKKRLCPARKPSRIKPPRRLRVVVADDDRDAVLTLMMVLRHEGHEVIGVHSGQQVLSTLRKFDADSLLLDIAMPGLSGWEVAGKVRARYGPPPQGPLLIGISGKYKQGSDKVLSELVGFDHYLVKPYEPSDVLKLLAPLRYRSDTLRR